MNLITVTVTLKKSQWFGEKWIVYFRDQPAYMDNRTFRFTLSCTPDEVMKNISQSLNMHQIQNLTIHF